MIKNKNDFYEIYIDSFQYNAGIVGFLRSMQSADKQQGVDYDYEGNTLYISKALLADEEQMTDIFINQLLKKYKESSTAYMLLNINFNEVEDKGVNSFDLFCKRKTILNMLDLYEMQDVKNMMNSFISCKQVEEKRKLGNELQTMIIENNIQQNLYLTDIAFTYLQVFYNKLAILYKSQGNFNINTKENFLNQFQQFIFSPISIKNKPKEKLNYGCITCGEKLGANKKEMTFIKGTVADMGKKKSVFWDKKEDTYLCPICNMIYCFMALGFNLIGRREEVFVNLNDDVKSLLSINLNINDGKEEIQNTYSNVISTIVDLNSKYINKLQFIQISKDNRYQVFSLSRDKIKIFMFDRKSTASKFNYISTKAIMKFMIGCYYKYDNGYENLYEECFKSISSGISLYSLIYKLIRIETVKTNQIFNTLLLEIISKNINKEELMENKFNLAYISKCKGVELRQAIGGDADNKLRGYVYQLLNAVHSDNIDMFNDRVIRMYVGMQKQIPDIFINNFKSSEDFKTIAYAYILGLKGETGNQNDSENNQTNKN